MTRALKWLFIVVVVVITIFFFCSIHDRKMFVLGFCALMDLPKEIRPHSLLQCSGQILPALLVLFAGLKRAYESKCSLLLHGQISDNKDLHCARQL